MRKGWMLLGLIVMFAIGSLCAAQDEVQNIWERDTLTGGFFGINDKIAADGLKLELGATQIYQQNVRGGLSTHRRAGRFSGSYELSLSANMQKLFSIEGGSFYMLAEGSYSEGIDAPAVGSFFGVNGDAAGDRAMDITELWYEQSAFDGNLRLRAGKINLTCGFEHHSCPVAFDCSTYANDETSQFLNAVLVNNPTIPFPENGLGVAGYLRLFDNWYISAAAADADSDARTSGFKTAFDEGRDFFYIFETGLTPEFSSAKGPLRGAYRLGVWADGREKQKFSNSNNRRDDTGFYTACDQMIWKENDEPGDEQGLGVFFRYGWANGKVDDITNFWSAGFQYQGLFEGRDDDVFGFGIAQGVFTEQSGANDGDGYGCDNETVFETYYNIAIASWLNVSPDIQYVINPGGNGASKDAVVLGARVQIAF
ncbi:MAG: carbohydrate porin [Phycisphaerae bacterium]|nr:carbohydrate porin [Phycisphaerae bacterium]